jgi:ATP-dependent protease ClpP protease subunit
MSNNVKEKENAFITGERHFLHKKKTTRIKFHNPPITEATIYLSAFDENEVILAKILYEIRELKEEDRLRLIINSPGGYVKEGRSLINTIKSSGVEVITELLSDADSMAAVTFCIGDKRIVYENSSIMFHTFSTGYWGKGGDMKDYIDHTSQNLIEFFRSVIIGLTDKEIERMVEGKEWWFTTKEMCERGIATHVNINGVNVPAKDYLKLLKKVKKIGKKIAKKEGIVVKINSLAEAFLYGIDALTPAIEKKNKAAEKIQKELEQVLGGYDHDNS